jgi:hypothetical protein
VPHQVCAFHVVKEVVKAVLRAVASARKMLAATHPTVPKGRRRTQAATQAARQKQRLAQKGAELFTHRYLFVKHHLSQSERKTLWRITRGLPQLRKVREIMEQVYTLFDRRCRTQTALDKLTKLRRRLNRFQQLGETLKKLFSPTLEKALTFLDDKLLPSTSNAVERGQPALSQDAKARLPGAHARADQCPSCSGHVAGSPSRRPSTNPRITPSCTGWINPVSVLQSQS